MIVEGMRPLYIPATLEPFLTHYLCIIHSRRGCVKVDWTKEEVSKTSESSWGLACGMNGLKGESRWDLWVQGRCCIESVLDEGSTIGLGYA